MLATVASSQDTATVNIDTKTRHQTFRGWEVTARVWETDKKANSYDGTWVRLADVLASKLVTEAGINRLRIEIKSGHENPVDYWNAFTRGQIDYKTVKKHFYDSINDNNDPFSANPAGFQFSALDQKVETLLKPMARQLANRGEKLFVTLTFVDFRWTNIKGNMAHANIPEEYAELIHETFKHLDRKYGVTPDALEIILEPDNTDHWKGEQIGNAIVAATRRLSASGYAPRIIAPSPAKAKRTTDLIKGISTVPGAAALVDTISYHRYAKDTASHLQSIVQQAHSLGAETAMLEYTEGDIDDLFEDIIIGQVSSWQKFGVARKFINGGKRASDSYMLEAFYNGGGVRIEIAKSARLLAEVFQVFRSGATRVAASSNANWVPTVAAIAPNGSMSVALRPKRAGKIVITGLKPGPYLIRITAENGRLLFNNNASTSDDGKIQVSTNSAGVITLRSAP